LGGGLSASASAALALFQPAAAGRQPAVRVVCLAQSVYAAADTVPHTGVALSHTGTLGNVRCRQTQMHLCTATHWTVHGGAFGGDGGGAKGCTIEARWFATRDTSAVHAAAAVGNVRGAPKNPVCSAHTAAPAETTRQPINAARHSRHLARSRTVGCGLAGRLRVVPHSSSSSVSDGSTSGCSLPRCLSIGSRGRVTRVVGQQP
jgi:hypothetical protein